MSALDCAICGEAIDASGPGVVEIPREAEGTTYGWVAFIEDWRGGRATFIHPACFAEAHGIASLVEVVHRRDLIERGSVPRLMMEIDDLRKRLGDRA